MAAWTYKVCLASLDNKWFDCEQKLLSICGTIVNIDYHEVTKSDNLATNTKEVSNINNQSFKYHAQTSQ